MNEPKMVQSYQHSVWKQLGPQHGLRPLYECYQWILFVVFRKLFFFVVVSRPCVGTRKSTLPNSPFLIESIGCNDLYAAPLLLFFFFLQYSSNRLATIRIANTKSFHILFFNFIRFQAHLALGSKCFQHFSRLLYIDLKGEKKEKNRSR